MLASWIRTCPNRTSVDTKAMVVKLALQGVLFRGDATTCVCMGHLPHYPQGLFLTASTASQSSRDR